MKPVRVLALPFHDGREGVGRGAGPDALLAAGLAEAVGAERVERVGGVDPEAPEMVRVARLLRELAGRVAAAVADGDVPLVLSGDCIASVGAVAGAGPDGLGVVWLDAHADFDTPDDSLGFLDAMGLRMLTGVGWRAVRESVPGHAPIEEADVVLAGVRDLEPRQRASVASSQMRVVPGDPFEPAGFVTALERLAARRRRVYLHVDLDALDAREGRANAFAAPGGPSAEQLVAAVREVRERFELACVTLSAYEPPLDGDGDGGVAEVGTRVVVEALASPSAAGARNSSGSGAPERSSRQVT